MDNSFLKHWTTVILTKRETVKPLISKTATKLLPWHKQEHVHSHSRDTVTQAGQSSQRGPHLTVYSIQNWFLLNFTYWATLTCSGEINYVNLLEFRGFLHSLVIKCYLIFIFHLSCLYWEDNCTLDDFMMIHCDLFMPDIVLSVLSK